MNTGEVVELFEGGWLPLGEGLPGVRVIVVRHPAPTPGKPVTVGKRVGEWVYELFMTNLDTDRFLVEDVLDLYHGRGAGAPVLADEDVEEDPDRWCSYTERGQELWQIACQWVWNLRLSLGQTMQGGQVREIEWAPPKESPPFLVAEENPPQAYGPWQWAAAFGRATGLICAEAFVLQENGTLRCPAGASLWLSEVRQENAFTKAGRLPGLPDRLSALCSAGAVLGIRGQRRSGASRQCGSPSLASALRCCAKAHRSGIDALGRCGRSSASSHLDSPLASAICGGTSIGSSPAAG